MDKSTESVIREVFHGSNEGRMHFGLVVGNLLGVGVESYHVDYRAERSTYYLPSGEALTLDMKPSQAEIAKDFSAVGIKAAILRAQRGEIMYPEFKKLSQSAGCIGYIVWLSGRHVAYYGRNGETHIENFPS